MGNSSGDNEDKPVRRLHLVPGMKKCRDSNKVDDQRQDTAKPILKTKTSSQASSLHNDRALLYTVGTNSEAYSHQKSSSEQEIDMVESDFDSESSKRSSGSFYFRPTLESYAYTHRHSLRATANDSQTDNLYDDLEREGSDASETSA